MASWLAQQAGAVGSSQGQGQPSRYAMRASQDLAGLEGGEDAAGGRTPPSVRRSSAALRASVLELPSDMSPGRSERAFRTGNERLYEAYNDLHALAQDFEKPFDAPAILVVGHQTDGKSGACPWALLLLGRAAGASSRAVGGCGAARGRPRGCSRGQRWRDRCRAPPACRVPCAQPPPNRRGRNLPFLCKRPCLLPLPSIWTPPAYQLAAKLFEMARRSPAPLLPACSRERPARRPPTTMRARLLPGAPRAPLPFAQFPAPPPLCCVLQRWWRR